MEARYRSLEASSAAAKARVSRVRAWFKLASLSGSTLTRSLPLAVLRRQLKKILKQKSAIARFVRMLPARRVAMPIFERFFEMELHRVDELIIRALDHHLIAA